MDQENNSPQQSQVERTTARENPEQLFKKTLETSRRTINALVGFATRNSIAQQEFSHTPEIFVPEGHILLPPMNVMRSELAKIHGDTDITRRTRALTSRKTGEVFIPEEQAGSVHDVVHESIHRAVWLHGRQQGTGENETLLALQLAEVHGVSLTPEGRIDVNSYYIKTYASTDAEREDMIQFFTEVLKDEVHKIGEGLTEWTTQRARDLMTENGTRIEMSVVDLAYSDEVSDIEKAREKMLKEGKSADKVDAVIIAASLTGDIKKLVPYLF